MPVEAPLVPELRIAFEPVPELDRLERLWRDLESRADGSFFLSWGWIGCWLERLPPQVRPGLLVARHDDDEVVALAVLVLQRSVRHRFVPSRGIYLNETGAPQYDQLFVEYNGVLADRRWSESITENCLEYLWDRVPGWDELFLSGVTAPYSEVADRIAACI